MFDKYQAFILDGKEKILRPIKRFKENNMNELFGIERQKELLILNTKKFIEGIKVNNVLLWGERGTGKTALVRSLLNYFRNSPLRIIQVFKSDISNIPHLYESFYENENLRFIIFIDDLSFNENDQEFKDLKLVMDGGLEELPENSVIYATSNRRNLIPVSSEDELFPEDSIQERASLIERFGLRIGFYRFPQELYLDIVNYYAKKMNLNINSDDLARKALEWAISNGTSGRSAYQFVLTLQIFS